MTGTAAMVVVAVLFTGCLTKTSLETSGLPSNRIDLGLQVTTDASQGNATFRILAVGEKTQTCNLKSDSIQRLEPPSVVFMFYREGIRDLENPGIIGLFSEHAGLTYAGPLKFDTGLGASDSNTVHMDFNFTIAQGENYLLGYGKLAPTGNSSKALDLRIECEVPHSLRVVSSGHELVPLLGDAFSGGAGIVREDLPMGIETHAGAYVAHDFQSRSVFLKYYSTGDEAGIWQLTHDGSTEAIPMNTFNNIEVKGGQGYWKFDANGTRVMGMSYGALLGVG